MLSSQEALKHLRAGNRRYVAAARVGDAFTDAIRRKELLVGQSPFAAVLGCSDSRVPAEIVFDQGLGDLFVVRVAGNTAGPSQIGSIEFAVAECGTRLVVVLGHSHCGAIETALAALTERRDHPSPHLQAIADRVRPAIEPLLETELGRDHAAVAREAVRANVRATVEQLRRDSKILTRLSEQDGLLIVGAEYSLETGAVEFFTEEPQAE
jgi:carbonic anhydrase